MLNFKLFYTCSDSYNFSPHTPQKKIAPRCCLTKNINFYVIIFFLYFHFCCTNSVPLILLIINKYWRWWGSYYNYQTIDVINFIIIIIIVLSHFTTFPISFIYCFLNELNLQTGESRRKKHLFIFWVSVCILKKNKQINCLKFI